MNFCRQFRQRRYWRSALKRRRNRQQNQALDLIDQMVENFGKRLPYLKNNRSEMIPLVHHAGRYINSLVKSIPGPVTLDPADWDQSSLIHSLFISENHARRLLDSSTSLKKFFNDSSAEVAYALLTALKKEKTVTGTERTGEIVRRDVIQKAIYFEEHKITLPTDELAKSRRMERVKLFSVLFAAAAERISSLKELKSELEVQHDEIIAKKDLLQKDDHRLKEISEIHDSIEKEIEEIGATLDSSEDYLAPLKESLQSPEKHLWTESLSLKLNSMGIVISDPTAEKADPFFLAEIQFGGGRKNVATWIRIERDIVISEPR